METTGVNVWGSNDKPLPALPTGYSGTKAVMTIFPPASVVHSRHHSEYFPLLVMEIHPRLSGQPADDAGDFIDPCNATL